MKIKISSYFLCPKCKKQLTVVQNTPKTKDIKTGILKCLSCNCDYLISNFIPRFCDQNNYVQSFGFQWNRHRKTQIDKFNGYNFSRNRLFTVTEWPKEMSNEFILEVGSGAGRFTQILIETKAQIFSFDFSNAVDANIENNNSAENLNLFQADLYNIPLREEIFDKILCMGVLQHTPDPKKAFMALIPFLKDGGEIVIDIYNKSFISKMHWKYILRPILKNIDKGKLYNYINRIVPYLLPISILLRKVLGSFGNRILPITNYSNLDIPYEMNKEWSVLDTFDMYSPKYDNPQSLTEVKNWFKKAQLQQINVRYGQNGIIGKGIKNKRMH